MEIMAQFGFNKSPFDSLLLLKQSKKGIEAIVVYVDIILARDSEQEIAEIKEYL